MLSINDYNHLKLLYDQFFKMNAHIKELIANKDWESANYAVQDKEKLLRQIIFFEKPRKKEIKENKELYKTRLKLIELEVENIELVKKMKEELAKELSDVKKTKKIIDTYEPTANHNISTFEIKDDEELFS